MKPFRYCPLHGVELEQPDHERGARCPVDGRKWYRNSAPTVGAVVVVDGKALLTKRGIEPYKGKYDIPGGFLAAGEDPVEGLKREVNEELGIEIDVGVDDVRQMAVHRYGDKGDYTLALGFEARWLAGEPKPADDVDDIRMADDDELDGIDFAWEHDKELVRKVLRRWGGE